MTATSPAALLAQRGNDYRKHVDAFEAGTGLPWHAPTPPTFGGSSLSVVVPVFDSVHSIATVLDSLAAQAVGVPVQVIVVDDMSSDGSTEIVAAHPVVDRALRLNRRSGAAAARNVGIALAEGDTLVFLDADVVPQPHVLADFAARAADDLVLLGFREPIPYRSAQHGRACLPARQPQLSGDHRVRWRAPVGTAAVHSGRVYTRPEVVWPLDSSADFAALGFGADRHGWDLPLMVVSALMAAPRHAVRAIGGFAADFGLGWGSEDAHLGARLIAAGCLVAPLRQALSFHVDPVDPRAAWAEKAVTASARTAQCRAMLAEPERTVADDGRTAELIAAARWLRR